MREIIFKNRKTKTWEKERVPGALLFSLFYGPYWFSKILFRVILPLATRISWASRFYGFLQKRRWSRRKIIPFIKKFNIDPLEFEQSVSNYSSFNAFFTRKLKPESRPIARGKKVAILPADGRYRLLPSLQQFTELEVKGERWDLDRLFDQKEGLCHYRNGSLVLVRLSPSDYHRFHFPFACIPSKARLIKGPLHSVHPWAMDRRPSILHENKRMITTLFNPYFDRVACIEVGATCVGSIRQTYTPNRWYQKGEEKGFFAFGGSSILLLFPQGAIKFASDLLSLLPSSTECLGKMGERLGKSPL